MYFQVAQTLVRRANSDERNHSACRFTLSAERKKSLVRAESALSGFPDIPHADSSQSLLVFIRQVEVNLLRTISSAKMCIRDRAKQYDAFGKSNLEKATEVSDVAKAHSLTGSKLLNLDL